jgi:hypothetical protein
LVFVAFTSSLKFESRWVQIIFWSYARRQSQSFTRLVWIGGTLCTGPDHINLLSSILLNSTFVFLETCCIKYHFIYFSPIGSHIIDLLIKKSGSAHILRHRLVRGMSIPLGKWIVNYWEWGRVKLNNYSNSLVWWQRIYHNRNWTKIIKKKSHNFLFFLKEKLSLMRNFLKHLIISTAIFDSVLPLLQRIELASTILC